MPAISATPLGRRALIGACAVLVAVAISGSAEVPAVSSADDALGYLSFKDAQTGTTFSVGMAEAGSNAGRFQFAASGIGLFWPAERATIELKSDSSVIVRYDGAGYKDAQAKIDSAFGFHVTSGNVQDAALRLEAQVNPDRITASAELWVDGVLYKLTDRRATADADADLTSILAAFKAQNWDLVYNWTYSGVRSQMTASEFAARSAEAFAIEGAIVGAVMTGSLSYSGSRAGFDAATAPVAFAFASGRTIAANASLIWEIDHWALLSIDPDS